MRNRIIPLAAGIAGLAFASGSALAQDAQDGANDSLLEVGERAPQDAEPRFDEAFPQMVSEPLVQGDLAPPGPLVAPWTADDVAALIAVIENIDAEGLHPGDYNLRELRALVRDGRSDELDELASRNFVWLVEDLRDGRTPMDAREQWFVVDPDRDRFRTGDLLAEALETGDVAGVLDRLNPTHPDYARLREALAKTPESKRAKRKLIRANMDRWRWLARDLGTQYLITNVPEYQLRLTVNDNIISTYRTIVGKPGRTATPQLAETVEGVVFNPTWTVPQSIVVGEGLGERVLGNPDWARNNGYVGTRGEDGYVTVVQQPGPGQFAGSDEAGNAQSPRDLLPRHAFPPAVRQERPCIVSRLHPHRTRAGTGHHHGDPGRRREQGRSGRDRDVGRIHQG